MIVHLANCFCTDVVVKDGSTVGIIEGVTVGMALGMFVGHIGLFVGYL